MQGVERRTTFAMTGLKRIVFMALSLSSMVAAVLLSQTGDVEISGILAVIAGISGVSYFSLRGLILGIPKFLEARKRILASLGS